MHIEEIIVGEYSYSNESYDSSGLQEFKKGVLDTGDFVMLKHLHDWFYVSYHCPYTGNIWVKKHRTNNEIFTCQYDDYVELTYASEGMLKGHYYYDGNELKVVRLLEYDNKKDEALVEVLDEKYRETRYTTKKSKLW